MTVGTLYINGMDRTPVSEWDAKWAIRTDGVGQLTVTIQDRTNDPTLEYGRERELISYEVGGVQQFDGEIVQSRLDLPVGMPWRRWTITATDWNTIFDLRLVGCPTGYTWVTNDGGKSYIAVDINAPNAGDDTATIVNWFDAYCRTSDNRTFDTGSFVGNYIANNVINDPYTGQPRIQPQLTTLRSAVDMLRAYGDRPIFCWIGPPLLRGGSPRVHWTVFPEVEP